MASNVFVASRLTRGNFLFPTRLVVTDQSVMRHKRSWFTVNEESVHLSNVATVDITTGLLWSDIKIESSGGSEPLESHGHTKGDARRIKQLIETAQSAIANAHSTEDDTRPCPHCAETIKRAAKTCRFCGKSVP